MSFSLFFCLSGSFKTVCFLSRAACRIISYILVYQRFLMLLTRYFRYVLLLNPTCIFTGPHPRRILSYIRTGISFIYKSVRFQCGNNLFNNGLCHTFLCKAGRISHYISHCGCTKPSYGPNIFRMQDRFHGFMFFLLHT